MVMMWGLKDIEIKLITILAKKEGRKLNGVKMFFCLWVIQNNQKVFFDAKGMLVIIPKTANDLQLVVG